MKTDINDLILVARKAWEAIMEYYKTDQAVDFKDDNSPVTAADMAAHMIIMQGLKEKYGDIPCISEEGDMPLYNERKEGKCVWLVDPLDGTKEFIGRRGDFTVNIALINGNRPVIGV